MNKYSVFGIALVAVIVIGAFVMGRSKTADDMVVETGTPVAQQASTDYHDNIYQTRTGDAGAYMTDFAGMTLYTYDRDTEGGSACDATCAQTWKPYTSGATAQGIMPNNITVITRADGSQQFAWKGKPLYYHVADQNEGDKKGNGVDGAWHIIEM